MPKILFIHQNYPAQFGRLGRYMARQGWEVVFATAAAGIEKDKRIDDQGVKIFGYRAHREPKDETHNYLRVTEQAVLNGQGFARLAIKLRNGGFTPDIVVAHSGWGSGTFTKAVWPETKFVQYLEWWYEHPPRDAFIKQPEKNPEDQRAKILCKNIPFMMDWAAADGVIIPTQFQADGLPDKMSKHILVEHDGADTEFFQPNPDVELELPNGQPPADVPVVTYATRGMEPYRGFTHFMEALSKVQKTHKDFHTIIGGNDSVHYGGKLPKGDSWKKRMLKDFEFDHDRMYWPGKLPFDKYRNMLQRSNCHVYLTVPFVLSWSCVEAMATGCPLIVSDTAPIREALPKDTMAKYVDHYNNDELADAIRWMLDNQDKAKQYGKRARKMALRKYSAQELYPRKVAYFERIIAGEKS